jgi:hypothetical protein
MQGTGQTPVFPRTDYGGSPNPDFALNPAPKWTMVKNWKNFSGKTPSPPFFPCRNPRIFCHLPVSSAMPPANPLGISTLDNLCLERNPRPAPC